uniref:Protease Do-like 7 n=1 Tax=Solanum tuberosum TaxID=4113 RepID=M1B464_SOLTU
MGGSVAASAEDWRKALDKVVPAVIVLRTNACQAFNTEAAGASYATGFVDFLYGAYIIPAI